MTIISLPVNKTPNTISGSPQLSGQVYTTSTTATGAFLTSNGSNGMTWTTGTPYDSVMKINQTNPPTIEVKGNMVINGRDLEERLKTIETLLQIPTRDVTMEHKHPKLAKLYQQYMHELEKYRTWHRIKGDEDGTT